MNRLKKFTTFMDMLDNSWRYIFIFNPLNAYYFTGTMQDGVLFIQRGEEPVYFIKRSISRAEHEIRYCKIMPYKSFEDIKNYLTLNTFFPAFIDKNYATIDLIEKFNSFFDFGKIYSCDRALSMCRSVKSKYELDILKSAGEIHKDIMVNTVPEILSEDISEHEAALLIYNEFIRKGHQAVVRTQRQVMEQHTINVNFSESSLKTYRYDSPVGTTGMYVTSPFLGSSKIKLKQSDLITISSVFAINGYHSVATYTYAFNSLIDYISRQQEHLVNLKNTVLELLKPGIRPSEIYAAVTENIHPEIQGIFMGLGDETVDNLGRGTGLTVDEYPIISKDNKNPLIENMVVSLGLFAALEGYGTTGMAHTYIVTPEGGKSINGSADEIIVAGKYL